MPKRTTPQEYQVELRQIYGPDQIAIEPYVNRHTRIKHKCTICGDIRLKTPYKVLMGTKGSMICCRQMPSTESYIAELEVVSATLVPIAPYLGRHKKSLHRCTICNSEREVKPVHILHGTGCFICAKENQSNKRFKRVEVKLGGYSHSLQGYEPQALALMLSYGANPKNIISKVSEGKPVIKYEFEGGLKTYIPDFYHVSKNRVIEVKSIWTLGLVGKSGGPFKKNKAKAKATIKAGYNFTLILIRKNGERVPLPRNWYDMTKAQVRGFASGE